MPPRKMQQIIAADPRYARTLGAGPAAPAAAAVGAPRPEERADEPDAGPAAVEAAPVETTPVETAPAPADVAPVDVAPVERPRLAAPPSSAVAAPQAPKVEAPASQRQGSNRRKVSTERVAVWVRPLVGQMDRIAATGLPTQDVLKAAWRKASARKIVEARYVEPPAAERAEGRDYCYATTLMLDTEPLTAIARVHDRLGIRSRWSLIRGQVEPAFWMALDELLAELAEPGPA